MKTWDVLNVARDQNGDALLEVGWFLERTKQSVEQEEESSLIESFALSDNGIGKH